MNNKHKENSTFVRLMKVMRNRLPLYLLVVVVTTVANAVFGIVSSYLLKDILNMAQSGDTSNLISSILINVSIGVISMLVWRFAIIIYNVEAKRGIANLEKQVFSKAVRLPVSYYESNHSGDFISRMIFDTSKAGDVFGSRFRRVVAPSISVIVYLVPMLILCWQLTLSMLALSLVTLIVNSLFVKPMKNIGTVISKENANMFEKLTNLIAAGDVIKIFGAGEKLSSDYKNINSRFMKQSHKQNVLSGALSSLNGFFEVICTVLFLLIGMYYLKEGVVTIGALAAVYTMYGTFNWHFLQLGQYMPELTNSLSHAKRVFEFIDLEPEKQRYDIAATNGNAYITVEGLGFAYDEERKIFDDFSMSIEKGECVALVGESGRGKSTVLKLLLGFYEPKAGRISIDGKGYGEYTLADIRQKISYVPQEPYLYNVSIAQNIAYGRPNATKEEIINAAKAAQAHDFIMKLEHGYDTVAGERGNRLSGGEKQRIAIARAILKDAPILILDEATSALDNESEQLVSEAIEKLMENRTTIMIAHRPSTIARADRVITI